VFDLLLHSVATHPKLEQGTPCMTSRSQNPANTPSQVQSSSRPKALPAHDEEEHLRSEVMYLLKQGWIPVVEHCAPSGQSHSPWYLWKLPMAGQHSVQLVVDELHACHSTFPHHDIRLVGYDNDRQGQGTGLTVYRAA